MVQILTSSERIKMSLFTQRHYEIVADRLGKEMAKRQLLEPVTFALMGAFENFFLEDNSKFSETKFERATMASAFKHGWN
jgi:hypothetical protein